MAETNNAEIMRRVAAGESFTVTSTADRSPTWYRTSGSAIGNAELAGWFQRLSSTPRSLLCRRST
ncbi:MAG TPA: hypothetical protein VJ757_13640 [Pseudonocardiaceae bacterium]|nr:hypothetical protein [Pseudonocardiaceae bacterium]